MEKYPSLRHMLTLQCPECRGAGYTKATLMASMKMIKIMAEHDPNGEVPVYKEKCRTCDGEGRL